MNAGKVLMIEDDPDIREGVRILLESEDYEVLEAENGQTGLRILDTSVDLVILDVMMPGISGFRTCQEIRKISNVPVLFLTAKSQESDKLAGLLVGGDDYLAKPFSYAELLGRVKALMRRYNVYMGRTSQADGEKEEYLSCGRSKINKNFNEVFVNEEEKELSDIQYKMLLLMMQHPNKIFSAQNLYESIWEEPYFYSCNNTVMVHIRNLRLAIETDPGNPKCIRTIWGKGYRFDKTNA